jgi:hypothetical protein
MGVYALFLSRLGFLDLPPDSFYHEIAMEGIRSEDESDEHIVSVQSQRRVARFFGRLSLRLAEHQKPSKSVRQPIVLDETATRGLTALERFLSDDAEPRRSSLAEPEVPSAAVDFWTKAHKLASIEAEPVTRHRN